MKVAQIGHSGFRKCSIHFLTALLSIFAIDGDTIVMDGEKIRVMGVDAPELHCRCPSECELAQQAKRFTQAKIKDGVTLEKHGRDKYGRTLARVYTPEGNLADLLIKERLGRPYYGRKRGAWCGGK